MQLRTLICADFYKKQSISQHACAHVFFLFMLLVKIVICLLLCYWSSYYGLFDCKIVYFLFSMIFQTSMRFYQFDSTHLFILSMVFQTFICFYQFCSVEFNTSYSWFLTMIMMIWCPLFLTFFMLKFSGFVLGKWRTWTWEIEVKALTAVLWESPKGFSPSYI